MIPAKPKIALKKAPTEFKNAFIEKLCTSEGMLKPIGEYDEPAIIRRNRTIEIIESCNCDKLDVMEVQKQCFTGIPDEIGGLRPMAWRVIFSCLPA